MRILLMLAALVASCCGLRVRAQDAQPITLNFTCTAPEERVDGSLLGSNDIVAFNLYEVSAQGEILAKAATWYQCGGSIDALPGTHRYRITVVDASGIESAGSNIVLVTTYKPKAVSDLQVRVVFKVGN